MSHRGAAPPFFAPFASFVATPCAKPWDAHPGLRIPQKPFSMFFPVAKPHFSLFPLFCSRRAQNKFAIPSLILYTFSESIKTP